MNQIEILISLKKLLLLKTLGFVDAEASTDEVNDLCDSLRSSYTSETDYTLGYKSISCENGRLCVQLFYCKYDNLGSDLPQAPIGRIYKDDSSE